MPPDEPTEAICVLFVTIDDGHAESFARAAIEHGLVACANLMPGVRSIYRWKGETYDDAEVVLWMETRAEGIDACIRALARLHPYDVPKIIAMKPSAVLPAYAQWCVEQTTSTDD